MNNWELWCVFVCVCLCVCVGGGCMRVWDHMLPILLWACRSPLETTAALRHICLHLIQCRVYYCLIAQLGLSRTLGFFLPIQTAFSKLDHWIKRSKNIAWKQFVSGSHGGPCDFHNHGTVARISILANKNRMYYWSEQDQQNKRLLGKTEQNKTTAVCVANSVHLESSGNV